jgi:hypothetical protein
MSIQMDWSRLRPWNGSQNRAFELLCNQLAGHEPVPAGSVYVPKGAPDAGVESYWIYPDESEWGFQAKFFRSALGDSQWAQIDDSVSTALEKHTKLAKYTVCLPIDRADPRKINEKTKKSEKWTKDKWDDHVQKWRDLASLSGRSIEFEYWGETEIADRLALEKHAGRFFFWFNKELFTAKWFREQLNRTIENADARYTPEINVWLPVGQALYGLLRDPRFFTELERHTREIRKHSRYSPTEQDAFASGEIATLNEKTAVLLRLLSSSMEADMKASMGFAEMSTLSEACREAATEYEAKIDDFEDAKREEARKTGQPPPAELHVQPSMFADTKGNLRRLINALYELSNFSKDEPARASNSRAILIKGDGGCGKTHLLCDVAEQRLEESAPAVLLLGQHFHSSSPWKQILDLLGLSCTAHEFLSALEIAGQLSGQLAMLGIDALNEGEGRTLWKNHLAGLLGELRRFPGVRVVLSVRSTYENLCVPQGISEEQLLRVLHPGFADNEYRAAQTFFAFYKIKQPTVPMLFPEFQNPLFLKTFCKALNNADLTEMPEGMQGITAVFDFFIDSINEKLAAPEYLDYDAKQSPVSRAVKAIADLMAEGRKSSIERATAQETVNGFLPNNGGYHKSLFFHLLSEGLLTENRIPDPNADGEWIDIVVFAYERFTDHLITKHLLLPYADVNSVRAAFAEHGKLHFLSASDNDTYFNRGLVEALSIQVPEKFGQEFADLVPHARESDVVRAAFLDSIASRKTSAFTEETNRYINTVALAFREGWEDLVEVFLAIATIPSNPYNARRLHRDLLPMAMAERDELWTLVVADKYGQGGAVDRLVDWATEPGDKSYINNESLTLCGLALGWLLTSPVRVLRDRATKGLVRLFTNRLSVLQAVLTLFAEVNDPYVAERLWCVAYGSALRSRVGDHLTALAQFTFDTIFKNGSAPPNILLRDYARGIVERALSAGLPVQADRGSIRPPYSSQLPSEVPSKQELEDKFGWSPDKDEEARAAWISIVGSVLYGGDFERYVIGTNSGTFPWSSRPIDASPLSEKQRSRREGPFDLELACRWIFNRVVELGWTPEKFGAFDRRVNRSQYSRRADKSERMGKKYQWIAFYEFVARVADNFQYLPRYSDSTSHEYQGPWQVAYARNIDPSCLLTRDLGDLDERNWWSPIAYVPESGPDVEKWVKTVTDLPAPGSLMQVRERPEGPLWLVLQTHRNFNGQAPAGQDRFETPYGHVWYMVRSYLVKKSDEGCLVSWLSEKSFWGRWMPESTNDSDMLLGEAFWSPVYQAHNNSFHGREGWTLGHDLPAEVYVTAEEYMHERVYDLSITEGINLLLPAKELVTKMQLQWSGKEAEFCDGKGELVAFDPSALAAGPQALLVRQSALEQFLNNQNLAIIWTVLGAKQWMTGSINDDGWVGELQLSGVYRLEGGTPVGTLSSEWKGPQD